MTKVIDTTMDKSIESAIDTFLYTFKKKGGYAEVGEAQIRKIIKDHLQVEYEADLKIIIDRAEMEERIGTFNPESYKEDVAFARNKFIVKLKELLFMGDPIPDEKTSFH